MRWAMFTFDRHTPDQMTSTRKFSKNYELETQLREEGEKEILIGTCLEFIGGRWYYLAVVKLVLR